MKYTVQCFVYSPRASIGAFAKLTDMVWGIDEILASFLVDTSADEVGIAFSHNSRLAGYFDQYRNFLKVQESSKCYSAPTGYEIKESSKKCKALTKSNGIFFI